MPFQILHAAKGQGMGKDERIADPDLLHLMELGYEHSEAIMALTEAKGDISLAFQQLFTALTGTSGSLCLYPWHAWVCSGEWHNISRRHLVSQARHVFLLSGSRRVGFMDQATYMMSGSLQGLMMPAAAPPVLRATQQARRTSGMRRWKRWKPSMGKRCGSWGPHTPCCVWMCVTHALSWTSEYTHT